MKKRFQKLLSALCAAALLLGLMPLGMTALAAGEHTLWIVGDSTACDYAESDDASYFYKRCGFGTALKDYVDDTYTVKNLAVSGRSSKSFPNESASNYQALTDGIKSGDVLLIAFGHNDEKTDDAHYTAPNGTSTTEGSFAKSLTDLYINVAKKAEASPILCTPIVRRTDSANSWSSDKLHQANGGDYAQDIRNLGKELTVPVVDMTALTKAKYDEVGPEESADFHAHLANQSVDNTHLNAYGAQVVAQILAGEIAKLTDLDIAGHIDSAKVSATLDKAAILVQNPDWKDPSTIPYDPPTTQSTQCKPYVKDKATFYGTAMGDLGGNASASNHIRETTAEGDMRIAVQNSKGKITGTVDGIVMYYYPVPLGKTFTLTAKATVNKIDASASNPGQGGFGLMARDDMYIDLGKNDLPNLASDYVTAGCLGDGTGVNFARKDGALNKNSTLALKNPLAEKASYDLSIVRGADGNYTCSIDGVSMTYDYSIDVIDGAYTYVGMFCARNMDVTYSDISLTVDGEVLCGSGGGSAPVEPVVTDAVAGGGLETLFAELPGVSDADITAVKYTGAMDGELTGEDLQYLVRDVEGGARVDIPGLKAGSYTLTVTAKGQDYVAEDLTVEAHDRSGFAHQTVDENNVCTRYTEGVGAYKDDGTLKENAIILYVTEENKNTVSLTQGDLTVTGIGNILNSKGWDQNHSGAQRKLLQKVSQAGIPIVVRIIGEVTNPEGTTTPWSKENGGSTDDGGHMCIMQYVGNITIEGIGPDATVNGWGFSFSADGTGRTALNESVPLCAKRDGQGENIEVRNLTFRNVPEDCIGINGSQGDLDVNGETLTGLFKDSAEHIWIHNNSFYGPSNLPDQSADGDKAEGDGAVDFRNGEYMTLSYNYFEGYHKTSLIGSGDTNLQYHVTWHHNHWKDCASRGPLARQADVHIYNNYYEGQTSYCMSLRASTYIFSEYNTFLNCRNVAINEDNTGVVKNYQDVVTNETYTSSKPNGFNPVEDKTKPVTQPSGNTNPYFNFDTAAGSYVAKGEYELDTAEAALENIAAYGGVMKAAADMDTVPMTIAGAGQPTPEAPVLTVGETAVSVKEGDSVEVTATATNDGAITVASAADATATATYAEGKVTITGVKAGETTVTVTATNSAGTDTETIAVTVTAEGEEPPVEQPVDKTALNQAIDDAKEQMDGIYTVSDDTDKKDVNRGTKFVTESDKAAIEDAIAAAEEVAKDEAATQDQVTEALNNLKAALGKIQTGTKTTTSSSTSTGRNPSRGDSTPTTVVKTDENGNTSKKTTEANGDVTITVTDADGETAAQVELPASVPSVGYKFVDVPDSHWAAAAINDMAGLGMVKGVDEVNHVFDMTSPTSRSAVAAILFRLSQGKEGMTADFSDVAADAWYADAVAWAAKYGIVTGYVDNTFDPDASVTREQLATMLYRYAKLLGMDVDATADLSRFTDGSSVQDWAADAMIWAVGSGIIKGKDTGALDGTSAASRAETAVMFDRFVALMK